MQFIQISKENAQNNQCKQRNAVIDPYRLNNSAYQPLLNPVMDGLKCSNMVF